jgi:Family of unknown function (DUF6616)
MAQPIYHLFLVRPTEAWHQLSHEEQDNLFAKVGEALEQVGGKAVLLCNSRWASEQWPYWGVEQYPDLEAVQKHDELLNAFNWHRYMESMTFLGTEAPSS